MVLVTPTSVSEAITARTTFDELLESNNEFKRFAEDYGITNLYADNNVQQLQQALYLGLSFQPQRRANDAIDCYGNNWELKSLTISKNTRGFSTANPLTFSTIERYRKCCFGFSIYYTGTMLAEMYVASPREMKEILDILEDKIRAGHCLNNPKIPLDYVRTHALKVYDYLTPDSGNVAIRAATLLKLNEVLDD